MNKRQHNILYHLHTVSGIVISVLLYVIFFAGSFSFFRDEIVNWERNDVVKHRTGLGVSVDSMLAQIGDTVDLYNRNITFGRHRTENIIEIELGASNDTTRKIAKEFYYVYTDSNQKTDYTKSYTLGEFLYRLHFFAQIPYPIGYYLSGIVALFFVFAIATGFLVHWKKIISNFFLFRPREKLKTIWTDAHTALGTIGLPFQFVLGVTGAFFMLKILVMLPAVGLFYDGDQKKMYEAIGFGHTHYESKNDRLLRDYSIDELITKTEARYEGYSTNHIHIFNYADRGMHVEVEAQLPANLAYTGYGKDLYNIENDELLRSDNPFESGTYTKGTLSVMHRIHFGDYAGIGLRLISFVLGLSSCFVILTGILIWLEARKKKKEISEKRKRFNRKVGEYYLAICLSMLPVTALTFLFAKVVPKSYSEEMMSMYYWFFFLVWLAASIFFILKKDNSFTNKYTLVIGGILGLLIPVADGIISSNWLWTLFAPEKIDFLLVDGIWLVLGICSLYFGWRIKLHKTD